MNIKMLMAVVLKSLGITAFAKDEAGKLSLSADQTTKLSELFGKEFAEKFSLALADHKEETSLTAVVADANEKPSIEVEGLVNALRAHHSTVVANGLKDLQAELQAERTKSAILQETVVTLSKAPEIIPEASAPTFKGADGKPVVMKVERTHAHYQGVEKFLQSGNGMDINAATIEVGQLNTEFGKFLSQNNNNLQLIKQLFNGFTSSKLFTSVVATTEYRAVRSFITSVSQQFSAKWNPGGKAKFTPLLIKNRRHKINYPIIPAEVLDGYMFKLYDEGMSPDQMPITMYIWNELVYPALEQDIELRMVWKGKFVDHSGTNVEGAPATSPEDSMDGIETILVEAKVSGTTGINFFNKYPTFDFRTATDEEILAFVNDFIDWISPFYKGMSMPLIVSAEFKRRYKRAYKNFWGAGNGMDQGEGSDKIDFSNNMLVDPDGMYGSGIIFTTPKVNMVKLRHKNEIPNVINDVQKVNYEVRLFGEFWLAVGFQIGEAVFAYVPANYNPKTAITDALGAHNTYQNFAVDDFDSTTGGI